MEYRTTDATAQDENGRFWITNTYRLSNRQRLYPRTDPLFSRFGFGKTHLRYKEIRVERLVELQFDGDSIIITDTPPIQLALDATSFRSWEAIARLDHRGFIVMNDAKKEETIMGFVPYTMEFNQED